MQPRITLVELPPASFGRLNGKKVVDVYSGIKLPPRACPLLHSILLKEGYKDVKTIDPNFNLISGKLSSKDFERIFGSDYLLLSAITRTILQTKELALLYKKKNPKGKVIVGGPHATFHAEECLEWADVVVRNEGDRTLPELIEKLEKNKSPKGVKGISYKIKGRIINEKTREPLTEAEMSSLPLPFFEESIRKKIDVLTISTSRGCPFNCNFCAVTILYGKRYRRKSNESIIRELKVLAKQPQKNIFFIDDNFAGNPEATKDLLRKMIALGLNNKKYTIQASVNSAFDPELLRLMKKAGVFAACIGVESINEETLRGFNKKTSAERNKEAIKLFRKAGIWVHAMMMIGGDGDTRENIKKTLDWAKDNCDSAQFFAPTPIVGTEFSEQMEKQNRVINKESYIYDGQHVVIRPKNLSPYELQKIIIKMYQEFYTPSFSIIKSVHPIYKLIIDSYARKQIKCLISSQQMHEHLKFLRSLETPIK